MKPTTAALLGAGLALAAGQAAQAQGKADFGKAEYDAHCAVCHGPRGAGDGVFAGIAGGDRDKPMANLTTLSQRNGGAFPFQRVYETIDGTVELAAHGTREMPIWGTRYRVQAGEWYFDVPYDPEVYVRTRILALAEYVNRLQAK